MRIRKDATSWRAGGVLKRDARHEKTSDTHRPVAAKKDTKRWCRGKVGREHDTAVFRHHVCKDWLTLNCKRCGKQIDSYFPWKIRVTNGQVVDLGKDKPDWAKDST